MKAEPTQSSESTTFIVPGSTTARRRALLTFVGFTVTFVGIAGLNPGTAIPLVFRVACGATGLVLGGAVVVAYSVFGTRMFQTRLNFASNGKVAVTDARGNVLEDSMVSSSQVELRASPGGAQRYWLTWQDGRVALPVSESDFAAIERLGVRRSNRPPPRRAATSIGRTALWVLVVLCVLTPPALAIYQRVFQGHQTD